MRRKLMRRPLEGSRLRTRALEKKLKKKANKKSLDGQKENQRRVGAQNLKEKQELDRVEAVPFESLPCRIYLECWNMPLHL